MKTKILKLSFTLLIITNLISCNNDDNEQSTTDYPKTLEYIEEGNSTLEYWLGGELTNQPAENYTNYFDNDNCLNYFNEETDIYCKNTKITFENDNNLVFNYNGIDINSPYEFVQDTLKITVNNQILDLAIGNRSELKIYGNLNKFNSSTNSGCGGDEFLKFNFYT